jgi:hypothetical protein
VVAQVDRWGESDIEIAGERVATAGLWLDA